MREQIMNLLASGASQAEVMQVTGINKDYLAELLKDKIFIEELRAKRDDAREVLIQQGYAKLEHGTINAIKKEIDAGMLDAAAMCRVLETAAKNRALYRNPTNHYQNNTVHLTVELKVPQGADNANITFDQSSGQIVAIGDRSMTAMPAHAVQKMFAQIDKDGLPQLTEREIINADLGIVEGEPDEQTNEARASARAA